jgi:carbon monoxide dehydrogenase subunit G
LLTDIERIAPMMPGAQLTEVEGEEYRGVVKVKVGPITAQYKGAAEWVEQDEATGRAVLKASGRDTKGQGNATARIIATMTPEGERTRVKVETELTVTGKVAQFGRGVLAEVSSKLLDQFVASLEADLEAAGASGRKGGPAADADSAGEPESDAGMASADGDAEGEPEGEAEGAAEGEAAAAGKGVKVPVRIIEHPESEPVDLLAVAGRPAAKRLAPVVAGLVAIVAFAAWRRRRRG